MAEVVDTAQKPYQGAELRAKAPALHSRWQFGAGARVAVRADQPVQLMLNHKLLDLGNVDHLMAMRFWIHTTQRFPATAAGAGVMGDDIRALLCGDELTARARMAVLAAALAAAALAFLLGWGLVGRRPSAQR